MYLVEHVKKDPVIHELFVGRGFLLLWKKGWATGAAAPFEG